MTLKYVTQAGLRSDLRGLNIRPADGLFVHASLRAIGPVIGGPRGVVEALIQSVGQDGLIGMPGFSTDAYFPGHLDREDFSEQEIQEIETSVLGFDAATSSAIQNGLIAEIFRGWSGVYRSPHPTTSVCLWGQDAQHYSAEHTIEWACGADTPMGRLCKRPKMKVLLIGVGWNRCTSLHTAEGYADPKRIKTRRYKSGPGDAEWVEAVDVADDIERLFPAAGAAFENTGAVTFGKLGNADCRVFDMDALVRFGAEWISDANLKSGDRS